MSRIFSCSCSSSNTVVVVVIILVAVAVVSVVNVHDYTLDWLQSKGFLKYFMRLSACNMISTCTVWSASPAGPHHTRAQIQQQFR